MKTIDLRSDTVTKPTQEMREAMFHAEVGDDVFNDDPTVNALQKKAAEILGKEAALYVPSGTMANQIAIAVHTQPSDELYCESSCHIRNYESGAAAALSGVMLNAIDGIRGAYTAEDVIKRLRPKDSHFAQSALIWVENSANRGGGAIFPQSEVPKLRKVANDNGLKMHLDGARLWNVAVASGTKETDLARDFDTVSVCFSKGLGCPVGSLIAGSAETMQRAHRFRKRFGGGMRQAGVLAACAIYAIDNHRERMKDDHRRARLLAETVHAISSFEIDMLAVQTNIVIFNAAKVHQTGVNVASVLKENGILCTPFGDNVRFVTHLDVDDEGIEKTVDVLKRNFA